MADTWLPLRGPNERTVLYRFFNSAGDLLYVGITRDPASRIAQHGAEKPWWHVVANVTLEWHDSRQEALDAERAAIIAEQPAHNVIHNLRRPKVMGTGRHCPDLCEQCSRIMSPWRANVETGETDYVCRCGHRWTCWWAPESFSRAMHSRARTGGPVQSMSMRCLVDVGQERRYGYSRV